jgi:deoxyadenosine/deoxycytidine kinase
VVVRLFLEGNIGAGKSTFLGLVKKYMPSVDAEFEPIDAWMKAESGQTLLSNFYKKPERWAYMMEVVAMVSRVKMHLKDQELSQTCKIVERSIYSGHYCFAQNDYEQGYMTKAEWAAYNSWVEFLVEKRCTVPAAFIYLRAEPEVCYKRILKRDRNGESKITLDYLNIIHKKHDKFLLEKSGISEDLKNIPVLELDCNADFINSEESQQDFVKKLGSFLRNIGLSKRSSSLSFEAKSL